jgi:putative membrane protein
MWDWMGGHMGFGMIFWILAIVLAIVVVVLFINRPGATGAKTEAEKKIETSDSPLEELERRYARGEIPREEYLEKRKDLTGE